MTDSQLQHFQHFQHFFLPSSEDYEGSILIGKLGGGSPIALSAVVSAEPSAEMSLTLSNVSPTLTTLPTFLT